jgi:hypothetical protein
MHGFSTKKQRIAAVGDIKLPIQSSVNCTVKSKPRGKQENTLDSGCKI